MVFRHQLAIRLGGVSLTTTRGLGRDGATKSMVLNNLKKGGGNNMQIQMIYAPVERERWRWCKKW